MVKGLLDTTILVDMLRSYLPAKKWLDQQQNLSVTSIVWLEILEGAQDKRGQNRALELLRRFERIDLMPADFDWAIHMSIKYKLSHNIGMMDCLIASVSHRLNIPLYTINLKHFTPLIGTMAQKPYE